MRVSYKTETNRNPVMRPEVTTAGFMHALASSAGWKEIVERKYNTYTVSEKCGGI